MKSFVRVAAVGVTGVVLFKVGTALISPLLGMFLGLLMLTVKLAVAAAVIYFIYSIIKPRDEEEVEVEVSTGADMDADVEEADVVIEED